MVTVVSIFGSSFLLAPCLPCSRRARVHFVTFGVLLLVARFCSHVWDECWRRGALDAHAAEGTPFFVPSISGAAQKASRRAGGGRSWSRA